MTTSKETYPNEYLAFRLGKQRGELRLHIEFCLLSFEPILIDCPAELESQEQQAKDRWGSVDLLLHSLRESLVAISNRGQNVKKLAKDAIDILDGTVMSVSGQQDMSERKQRNQDKKVAALLSGDASWIGNTVVFVPPVTDQLFGHLLEYYEQQKVIYEHWDSKKSLDPEQFNKVLPNSPPVFDSDGWKKLSTRLFALSQAMGGRCLGVYEIAYDLSLCNGEAHLSRYLPFYHWSAIRRGRELSNRIEVSVNRLEALGFPIDQLHLKPDTTLNHQIEEVLPLLESHRESKTFWKQRMSHVEVGKRNVYAAYSGITWRNITIEIEKDFTEPSKSGGYTMRIVPSMDGVDPIEGTIVELGFIQKRNPSKPRKEWIYMGEFLYCKGTVIYERDDDNRYTLKPPKDGSDDGRKGEKRTRLAIIKQISNLKRLLNEITGFEDDPFEDDSNSDCVTFTCSFGLVGQLSFPRAQDDDDDEWGIAQKLQDDHKGISNRFPNE